MLEQALEYADNGFSVIPISSDSKKPLVKWQRFQHERVSKARIEKFWKAVPNANIGLVCGMISDLIAIDIDPRNGGESSLLHYKLDFNNAPRARTPSRGLHYYYRNDDRIKKFTPYPGIDVQSEGSYILAPPSQFTCGKYLFDSDTTRYTNRNVLPQWIFNTLSKTITKLDNWKDFIGGVNEETRNNTATRIAGGIIQKTNDPAVALATVRGWNINNTPPLEDDELQTIVYSVWNLHQKNHKQVEVRNIGPLLKQPVPKIQWMIRDFWPLSHKGFIAGEPEQGKTWIALDMAVSISQGWPFLNTYEIVKKGPILLIEEEQSEVEILQRLELLLHGRGKKDLTLENFHAIIQKGINLPKDTDKIIQILQREQCVALFIDSFRGIHSKEENSSTEMEEVLSALNKIRNDTGVSIVIIHHLSKGLPMKNAHPLSRMRGTIHLLAWADTAIGLVPNDAGSHNIEFKMRGAPKPHGLTLHRTFDPIEKTMKLTLGDI